MTQDERNQATAFIASLGFERSDDLQALTASIETAVDHRRELAEKRDKQEAREWAPGGWRHA